MNNNHSFKPALAALLSCVLVSALALAHARYKEQKNENGNSGGTPNKNSCMNEERAKFDVKCKDRYFLGETPTITISITNTSRSPQTVKEPEYQKFSLEMTGIFQNDSGQYKKTGTYDGSWDIPKEPTRAPAPGETQVWLEMKKREPKYAKLLPGESTKLELDLSRAFGSYLGVSKYQLTVKSEDGQKVVKEFEVYFDDEKSIPVLAKMLASNSDDVTERHWAVSNLAKFNRTKFIALLEELIKSGNEKQRDLASGMLGQTKAGWFDYIKLKAEMKDRFFLGEAPSIAISVVNGSSTIQTVTAAEYQKFSLELTPTSGNDSKRETKPCVYDGSQNLAKTNSPGKPKLVKLSELESTTLRLDLSQCFHVPFGIGKYELIVKAADEREISKYQQAVKKFEVYFDDQKSVLALAQLLKSDDPNERSWAVSNLAQFNRSRLIALLEDMVKSGTERQRDFANGILAELKAGHFGPDPALSKTKQSAKGWTINFN